jgi:hypothetical protein
VREDDRQDADRDGFKWAALLNGTVTLPEAFDLLKQKVARPFGKNNREEENADFDFGSTILRHDELYHEASWWARREERLCPPLYVAIGPWGGKSEACPPSIHARL